MRALQITATVVVGVVGLNIVAVALWCALCHVMRRHDDQLVDLTEEWREFGAAVTKDGRR